jgi:tetratricopeptide (TPR) repeat protein
MAGNKSVYTDAMRKGHNLAWDGHDTRAIIEYRRALAEYPDDLAASSSLGSVLQRLHQLDEALAALEVVRRKAPQDIVGMVKMAEVQAGLGKVDEAGAAYATLAAAYASAGMPARALGAWQQMANLLPESPAAHVRLGQALSESGKPQEASNAYLTAARLYRKVGNFPEAVETLERAILNDATNGEASSLLNALRGVEAPGQKVGGPSPSQVVAHESQARLARDVFVERPAETPGVRPQAGRGDRTGAAGDGKAGPPVARQQRVETLIGQALELQSRGDVNAALSAYEQVVAAGVRRPEVEYNLGLLYQQAGRYEEAIEHLTLTAKLPDYAMGSHFAIAQCFKSRGDNESAMEHLLAAASAVNMASVEREQADDIIALYRGLADGYKVKGQSEKAVATVTGLIEALRTKGWEDKLPTVNAALEGLQLARTEPQAAGSVIEADAVADVPEWKVVAQKLAAYEGYLQEQHYVAAIEECHDIINLAPGYLPIHYRLGAVYLAQGRIEQAVDKYLMLSTLHVVRNELPQAVEACRLAAQAAPREPGPRAQLAQLLVRTGHADQALEELDVLGDLQLQRGQREEAKATIRRIISMEPPDIEGYQNLLNQLEASR